MSLCVHAASVLPFVVLYFCVFRVISPLKRALYYCRAEFALVFNENYIYVCFFCCNFCLPGLTREEREELASPKSRVMKISRRDLSYALSDVRTLSQKRYPTLYIAYLWYVYFRHNPSSNDLSFEFPPHPTSAYEKY